MKRVYFIKTIGMAGPIKIGTSNSPTHRAQDLATWSPFPLEVVATVDGGVPMERRFHAAFQHSHRGREWFEATPELIGTIKQINAGTFDFETLPTGITLSPCRGPRKAA